MESMKPRKSTPKTDGNGSVNNKIEDVKQRQKQEAKNLTLLKAPLKTSYYFFFGVIPELIQHSVDFIKRHKRAFSIALLTVVLFTLSLAIETPLKSASTSVWSQLKIVSWWVLLGILSSVGLGTGLHTFVLYLGPFIASTTLAATECKTTKFDTYGPNRFTCQQSGTVTPSFFEIWTLVALESFMWGVGTAIGELPPYFVARAARIAGEKIKDLDELESTSKNESYFEAAKRVVISWLGRIGFLGILLFASIPNPLFDLAGLTCGHMLIPFTTFFTATLIGKAGIKVTLQTIMVITVFDKDRLATLVSWIDSHIPFASGRAQALFDNVRKQYHRQPGDVIEQKTGSKLFILWDIFLILMISYFLMSIVNSSVQDYVSRLHEKEIKEIQHDLKKKTKET